MVDGRWSMVYDCDDGTLASIHPQPRSAASLHERGVVVGSCAEGRLAAARRPLVTAGVLYPSRDWGPQLFAIAGCPPAVPGPQKNDG